MEKVGTRPIITSTATSLKFARNRLKQKSWRKRVGVEPTTLAAKDRVSSFEDREVHRNPFASAVCNNISKRIFAVGGRANVCATFVPLFTVGRNILAPASTNPALGSTRVRSHSLTDLLSG